MAYKHLITSSDEDGIFILKISCPNSLNALNSNVLNEMDTCISSLPAEVRVLIITGDGSRAFVAGADISEMRDFNAAQGLEFGKLGSALFKKIEDLQIPVIAAVNGFALGGGCELALACDIRIASKNAKFGQPEVGLGIIPGFSGTYRLPKIVGQGLAKEMIYTGKAINATEALRIGLVNKVVDQDELMDEALTLARKITNNAPIAVRFAKKCINDNYDLNAKEAISLENKLFSECFSSDDQKEGMNAFLNKEKPLFKNK